MSDLQLYSSERASAPASTVMASHVPRKCDVLCGRNERRVYRKLHVTQDVLDDTSLGDRRDDPQPALLTHRAAFHVHGKDMP